MTQAESETAAPEVSLSERTSRGFAWMLAQTLGSKVVGIVNQIFLARLLAPADYGLVAIAYMAASLPAVLRQTGIPTILVQKGDRFDRWANAAFWMELALGALATLLMLAAAPVAAWFYHAPILSGLIALIAISAVPNALQSVPGARLTRDLCFRELAAIGLGYNLLSASISVGAAFWGCGAYSFLLPLPLCVTLRGGCYWRLRPVRVRLNPQFHRWRAMAADSGRLMAGGIFGIAPGLLKIFALGLFYSQAVVGWYSFAGNLSGQVLVLLSANLAGVLFPVLSKLKEDPPRQVAAFFRSARALALAGVPLCLAEAVLARPLLLAVFSAKWLPAVPLLTLLALAAAINIVGGPAGNLMQAQGRFHLGMKWSMASAVLFAGLVFAGVKWGGPAWVATADLACALMLTPVFLLSATRPGGGSVSAIAKIYLLPLLFSALALAPAALGEFFCPCLWAHPWAELALSAITAPPIYVILVRRFRRADVDELAERFGKLLRRAVA